MKQLVYVIEDNPVQQKMLQVHFEEMLGGYEVKTFATAKDLFTRLEEKPYAIVLDHFLSDGTTGLEHLRELRKKYTNIPVIYYTTFDDDTVRNEVMELGAEQYILKDSASLVRLRTALDAIKEKYENRGFFKKLFG
jgi:CheY-like chemotaxis protein